MAICGSSLWGLITKVTRASVTAGSTPTAVARPAVATLSRGVAASPAAAAGPDDARRRRRRLLSPRGSAGAVRPGAGGRPGSRPARTRGAFARAPRAARPPSTRRDCGGEGHFSKEAPAVRA
eukprot:CAMPEP_0185697360 /NCGR_PEP_ID=MMETSP1164-20130828/5694_1 /TAXON_ID=1104430 /ORGANISM="Chrysoreinhardia sp, Strain CCMP2950" /LENGTH=121 /DNA_ID=CAMNT_0028364255 /DNA_START=127 /DNA_END=492 /DNA_ORIENTATION=+